MLRGGDRKSYMTCWALGYEPSVSGVRQRASTTAVDRMADGTGAS
jgi:hypothetical protein